MKSHYNQILDSCSNYCGSKIISTNKYLIMRLTQNSTGCLYKNHFWETPWNSFNDINVNAIYNSTIKLKVTKKKKNLIIKELIK